MYKPTIKDLAGIILIGVGVVLALAFTDFGLSGAALAGTFTMMAEYRSLSRQAARSCRLAQS